MDSENASGIILPLIIFIAVLAACGILGMVMAIMAGIITLA